MKNQSDHISECFRNPKIIVEAASKGVRQALRKHKQAGVPIATWRNNQVVIIPPEEINVKDE